VNPAPDSQPLSALEAKILRLLALVHPGSLNIHYLRHRLNLQPSRCKGRNPRRTRPDRTRSTHQRSPPHDPRVARHTQGHLSRRERGGSRRTHGLRKTRGSESRTTLNHLSSVRRPPGRKTSRARAPLPARELFRRATDAQCFRRPVNTAGLTKGGPRAATRADLLRGSNTQSNRGSPCHRSAHKSLAAVAHGPSPRSRLSNCLSSSRSSRCW